LGGRRKIQYHPDTTCWRSTNELTKTYQNGPETPYCQATLDDWRRVAAHVQWLTITEAVNPVLIIRPADLRRCERETYREGMGCW
jgi:hypothetical protein